YFAAAGIGFGSVLNAPLHRKAFLDGFVTGALVSSASGIFQAIFTQLTGAPLFLANSDNFSLVSASGRAIAFTAEASVLAGLLLSAVFCVWIERNSLRSMIAAPLRSQWVFVLLC